MFNLWTDGVRVVDRIARIFDKKSIAHSPLNGLVDGVNQYFYAQYYPIITSGSVYLYTSGSAPLADMEYTLDYDAGLFTLNTAPSVQPSATYQTARFSDYTIKSLLVAGFDEMEGRWFRGMSLSETTSPPIIPITEDSPYAYVVSSSGSEPTMNGVAFADSHAQINFFSKCVQYAYYLTMLGEIAQTNFIYAEAQGAKIDKSMTAKNLKLAIDLLEKAIEKAKETAQVEYYGSSVYGGAVLSPYTRDFVAHHFWQQQSIAQNWRGNTQYVGDRW